MRSREVEGQVRAAVARRTMATATVHGRVRPRLRLRCMASAASLWVAGAWLVGAWLAGARQVGACTSSWMSSHTARLALWPNSPSQCIACASLDLQKSFHSCASLCLYSWWCGKPSAPSTCRASAVSCLRVSRQVSKHVDKAITPYVASPPHYLRTTCERLTSYWLGLAHLLHLVEHVVARHEAVGVHLHEEGAPLVVNDEICSGVGWSGLGLGLRLTLTLTLT